MPNPTPGPWEYNPASGYVRAPATPVFKHGQPVAKVMMGTGKNANENARLIAAAPELLEALEFAKKKLPGLIANVKDAPLGDSLLAANNALADAYDYINAVIAKARGEA